MQRSSRWVGNLEPFTRRFIVKTSFGCLGRRSGATTVRLESMNRTLSISKRRLEWQNFFLSCNRNFEAKKYRATAVRRCWIDKPGKPEKRPLGIPVIKDRVCQMACKLVIEPIFEANFLNCSNGFRPKRSAHHAVRQIKSAVTYAKQTEVIDADIRGFFDNLSQKILLNLVGRRINDRRVIRLIQCWLEAGVMDGGELTKSDGVGTPQGGVISPLLSNIYLHSFDTMFKESGIKGTLVRYAGRLCARQCVHEMRVGPSQPACGGRLQTTVSGCGKESWS